MACTGTGTWHDTHSFAMCSPWRELTLQGDKPARRRQFVERIQLNGKIRRSFVLEALPCHPQVGLVQESSSSPNISIASSSESDRLVHFFCKLMLWWPLGHSKTNR